MLARLLAATLMLGILGGCSARAEPEAGFRAVTAPFSQTASCWPLPRDTVPDTPVVGVAERTQGKGPASRLHMTFQYFSGSPADVRRDLAARLGAEGFSAGPATAEGQPFTRPDYGTLLVSVVPFPHEGPATRVPVAGTIVLDLPRPLARTGTCPTSGRPLGGPA
jgi:hypothetical protein